VNKEKIDALEQMAIRYCNQMAYVYHATIYHEAIAELRGKEQIRCGGCRNWRTCKRINEDEITGDCLTPDFYCADAEAKA
jgi:hypothetical protein